MPPPNSLCANFPGTCPPLFNLTAPVSASFPRTGTQDFPALIACKNMLSTVFCFGDGGEVLGLLSDAATNLVSYCNAFITSSTLPGTPDFLIISSKSAIAAALFK